MILVIMRLAIDALLSAFIVLSRQNIPIEVLINTGCLQTNVVSERIATLNRQNGSKLRPANLVLTSGVGGVMRSKDPLP